MLCAGRGGQFKSKKQIQCVQVIMRLEGLVKLYQQLENENWYLDGSIDDDYGFLKKDQVP